jgi:hypothetical protein
VILLDLRNRWQAVAFVSHDWLSAATSCSFAV